MILGLTALTGGTMAYAIGSAHQSNRQYTHAVHDTWRHTSDRALRDLTAVTRELVRYATLAASSHNTQCWKFAIGTVSPSMLTDQTISILPDWTRRCPAVDPDDHHLFVSLGCATENLIQAAQAFGKHGVARFDLAIDDRVTVSLAPSKAIDSDLFKAIPHRQCSRVEYNGKTLSNADLATLERAGQGNGVRILLLTDKAQTENILEYVVQGNTAQMNDRAFIEELKSWIRFSYNEVLSHRDGLFAGSSGNPIVPRWLGMRLLNVFFTANSENDKYAKQIRSSAGIAIFVSERNDKEHWIETGRCYERFALQATALGIKNAFLNQPTEVLSLRPQFASYLGIGNLRPDLVVRFGYGPETRRSLRRPIESVLL
ncbi:Tat pathway signal protein [Alkalinema sp. FACHB-956]|uniref:Acg family FMN-binding oxidoreductase n=1 Tax=Alkalinema sp. FACHB-956 TaxID=2692768 RepID=UPI001F54C963|nr:Tat pathway signal protein [Alkalinema sp. FACHB-956]